MIDHAKVERTRGISRDQLLSDFERVDLLAIATFPGGRYVAIGDKPASAGTRLAVPARRARR